MYLFQEPWTNYLGCINSNNQRLGSARDNDRMSKRFCSNAVLCVSFTWQMVKTRVKVETRVIKLCSDFYAFHSFLVESKRMLATYMRRMRNNNLEIKIAGSSCRPQLYCCCCFFF